MKEYNISNGAGELIVHLAGDNSLYSVTYDHGQIVFERSDRKYIIPDNVGYGAFFLHPDPNTGKRQYALNAIRSLYRDTTPTDFGLGANIVDAGTGASYFTEEIVVGGTNESTPVVAPAGVIIYVNGSAVSSGTTVENGDVVKFEITASEDYETTINYNLSVGDITKAFSVTTEVGNKIKTLSALSYDATKSYNGSSYPTVRYGGTHFQVSGDGKYLIYTYTDYNYHQQRRLTLTNAWDFSSMSGYISTGNIDLSNHYQNDMYISEDGLRLYVGGYSNANVAGWDDIYRYTMTSAWNPTSGSWTTFDTNFRTQNGMPISTAYGILGFNSTGTRMWVRNNIDTDNSTVLSATHLIRQYDMSVAWSQNWSDTSSLSGTLNVFDYINDLTAYDSGNGWNLLPVTMNKAGTQMLVSAKEYSGGVLIGYRIYKIDFSEGWNINSTITCDTTDYADVFARNQSGNQGIQGIKYGKDDREIILQVGQGTYGVANGVYSYWQTLN